MKNEEPGYLPLGFTLNLHKYFNRSPSNHAQAEAYFKEPVDPKNATYIVFGNFDRLSFCPISNFSEYRQEASKAYTWLGNRQTIMLYPLDNTHRVFGIKPGSEKDSLQNEFGLVDVSGNFSQLSKRYLIISLLYISGTAKAAVNDYNRLLFYCSNAIYKTVDTYNSIANKDDPITCEIFGTFSSAELAIIWSANEFADVLYLLDNLRHLSLVGFQDGCTRNIFVSSYTFVALADKHSLESTAKKGGALIQLAARTTTSEESISGYETAEKYIEELAKSDGVRSKVNSSMFCAGEYDIILRTDSSFLPALFNKVNNDTKQPTLNVHDERFNRIFLASTTRLYYTQDQVATIREKLNSLWINRVNSKESLLNVTVDEADRCPKYPLEPLNIFQRIHSKEIRENIRKQFDELRNKVSKLLPTSSGFLSTMDLVFSDYIQCVSSSAEQLWVKDFDSQFSAVIRILREYPLDQNIFLDTGDSRLNERKKTLVACRYLDLVQEMFHILQQQIYHIVDSSKLFFEEPRSHFSYTGQYDLLMHAYYGVLKCVLEQVYTPIRPQSRLYPLINFESTYVLSSRLYYNNTDITFGNPDRVLAIRLPYDAWNSMDYYIPMLIHELYHYAAPINRRKRNALYGRILMTALHSWIIEKALADGIKALLKDGIASQEEHQDILRIVSDNLVNRARVVLREQFQELIAEEDELEESGMLKASYINSLLDVLDSAEEGCAPYLQALASALHAMLVNLKAGDKLISEMPKINEIEKILASSLLDKCLDILYDLAAEDRKGGAKDREYLGRYVDLVDNGIKEMWEPLYESLNEIFPDIAMIRLAGLELDGYLLQFAVYQNNQLLKPSSQPSQTTYRIGIILDWLLGNLCGTTEKDSKKNALQSLESYRESFLSLYNSVYSTTGAESYVSGKNWFDYFCEAYCSYLGNFAYCSTWLRTLIEQEYLPCLNVVPHSRMDTLTKFSQEYYQILKAKYSDKNELNRALFSHILKIVQTFHLQKELEQITPKESSLVTTVSHSIPVAIKPFISMAGDRVLWEYHLHQANQLLSQLDIIGHKLRDAHRQIFHEDKTCQLWYRGSNCAEHDVLPSILVNFYKDTALDDSFNGRNHMGTLRTYQRHVMEAFKFRADGAPEIINNSQYLHADYLALMQHYSQHASFLDWSEDAYSSLYFALENYIDDTIADAKHPDSPAALYIMDPMLYNRARQQMMRKYFEDNGVDAHSEEYVRTFDHRDGYVPNVSIPENHRKYSMFLAEEVPISSEPKTYYRKIDTAPKYVTLKNEELHEEIKHLPVAIYTSRLNPRIRAQSGIFMAYNLRARPAWNPEIPVDESKLGPNLFHYLALESIQSYYLDAFPNENPFLLKLVIDADIKKTLGKTLRHMGLTRYRIYPELEQLKTKK